MTEDTSNSEIRSIISEVSKLDLESLSEPRKRLIEFLKEVVKNAE